MYALKKLKLPTVGRGCLKISFYGSHIDGIICVKKIDLGLARTLEKILKFCKNELRLCILIPRKYPRKTLLQHTVPPRFSDIPPALALLPML